MSHGRGVLAFVLASTTRRGGRGAAARPLPLRTTTTRRRVAARAAPKKEGRKRDPSASSECLQRSLKTADACMTSAQPPISLFVEILDHYLAHLEAGNPLITPKYIAGLVALIMRAVETMEAGEARGRRAALREHARADQGAGGHRAGLRVGTRRLVFFFALLQPELL